jgi:hypothetical protein
MKRTAGDVAERCDGLEREGEDGDVAEHNRWGVIFWGQLLGLCKFDRRGISAMLLCMERPDGRLASGMD